MSQDGPPNRRSKLTSPDFSQSLPVDKSLAMQIAEASRVEQSGAPAQSRSEKHSSKGASDSASIASKSSFGSTVGLLKNKFHSKPTAEADKAEADKKRLEEQKKIMRSQVNIVC